MKKKIKDLTIEEAVEFCSHKRVNECPLCPLHFICVYGFSHYHYGIDPNGEVEIK